LEAEPLHAGVARRNIARAGLENVVEIRLGPALDTLKQLFAEKRGPYDFIFIDADKEGYPDYFFWSLKLSPARHLHHRGQRRSQRRGGCLSRNHAVESVFEVIFHGLVR
jgi:hypothetical protein